MDRARALALALALILALFPAASRADEAILLGFTTGARLETGPHARFLVGGGPDLLTTRGLTIAARGEVTHVLDGALTLAAGWSGEGLRSNDGLPLGLGAGPALVWTHEGAWTPGARVRASWGLWYARAVVELDLTVTASDDPRVFASLSLRLVPWSPWRL